VPRLDAVSGNGANGRAPIVGWIGSPTTASYIRSLAPVLQRAGERHRFVLRVSGAGEPLEVPGVVTEQPPWALDREVELFNTCDIGVYPLPDDEWTRGKCGFKAIQFMACAVPVVASPVGVNREIIEDGVSGFLAESPAAWKEKLAALLTRPDLREALGRCGRAVVEERYSLAVNGPSLVRVFERVIAGGNA
jgi:glycosyltransferase involved in cell wall biosynthesis